MSERAHGVESAARSPELQRYHEKESAPAASSRRERVCVCCPTVCLSARSAADAKG